MQSTLAASTLQAVRQLQKAATSSESPSFASAASHLLQGGAGLVKTFIVMQQHCFHSVQRCLAFISLRISPSCRLQSACLSFLHHAVLPQKHWLTLTSCIQNNLVTDCREEAAKACEADALKARAALRQERLDWEKADAESRNALHSLREEWRMLQDTNAQLHANVTRLTKALEVCYFLSIGQRLIMHMCWLLIAKTECYVCCCLFLMPSDLAECNAIFAGLLGSASQGCTDLRCLVGDLVC